MPPISDILKTVTTKPKKKIAEYLVLPDNHNHLPFLVKNVIMPVIPIIKYNPPMKHIWNEHVLHWPE